MLLGIDQASAFLVAAVLVTISPGPDNLMVLGTGMSRGRAQGVVFGLGCALGCLSHTVLAALGIGALIVASPLAFGAMKICGGLYLVWLGCQALRNAGRVNIVAASQAESLRGRFRKGLLANAINPKVIIFFLSFLPQFVQVEPGQVAAQTALLGVLFTCQAAVIFGVLGYFSGTIGLWLNRHARAGVWLDRVAGTIFVGLGLRLVAAR